MHLNRPLFVHVHMYMYLIKHIHVHLQSTCTCISVLVGLGVGYWYLYRGAWAIAMVTFDVPREIHAHNMPVRQGDLVQQTLVGIVLWFLIDNRDVKCDLIAYFCVTMV